MFSLDSPSLDPFLRWLAEHHAEVRAGHSRYEGYHVLPDTKVTQFSTCVSAGILTLQWQSRCFVVGHDSVVLYKIAYTVLALLAGWWGIPWGPIFTVSAIITNLSGGTQRTVGDLIDELTGHPRQLIALTQRAADQVRRHIIEKRFPPHTALYLRLEGRNELELRAEFDDMEPDGRQWRGHSRGVWVLIDKDQTNHFAGKTIDWDQQSGRFLVTTQSVDADVLAEA